MENQNLVVKESENNPPEDRSQGWKVVDGQVFRWWMGNQWSESYRAPKFLPIEPRDIRVGMTIRAIDQHDVMIQGEVHSFNLTGGVLKFGDGSHGIHITSRWRFEHLELT